MRPTVLIVDDHEAFRDAARSLLETEGFEIVGEVAGGRDAPRRTPDSHRRVLAVLAFLRA